MSAWHDPDRTVVDAFLVKSQFRPEAYRHIAGSFAPSKMLPAGIRRWTGRCSTPG